MPSAHEKLSIVLTQLALTVRNFVLRAEKLTVFSFLYKNEIVLPHPGKFPGDAHVHHVRCNDLFKTKQNIAYTHVHPYVNNESISCK